MTNSGITKPGQTGNEPPESKVRPIGIVAFEGAELIDLTGPLDVFAMTDEAFRRTGMTQEPNYPIRIFAKQAGLVRTSSGLKVHADHAYGELLEDIDTLFIPGAVDVSAVLADPALQEWVFAMSTRVRRIVSVCTGAFLIAEIGLLDGRRATTHWAYCDRLASDYPSVTVEPDRIFLRDGPIATSGGVTSGIDLTLSLLEEDWGREVALNVARYMVVFLKRPGGQSQFSGYLVLRPGNNDGCSEFVCVHGKAHLAGNAYCLAKRCNAVHGRRQAHPKGAPVVSRSGVTSLDKGTTIACAMCLAAKHHGHAEPVIITWTEYSQAKRPTDPIYAN